MDLSLRSFVCSLLWLPALSYAVDLRPDLVEHSLKVACDKYLSSTNIGDIAKSIEPSFWFWQDKALKQELLEYRKSLPPEVEIVRPSVLGGDKQLLLTAEMNYSEFGYVLVALNDGTHKFRSVAGRSGRSALKRGDLIDAIASLLLDVDNLETVKTVVVTHTHPYVNFTVDFGMNVIPNEFSESDLESANHIKYYFEALGIYFPLQFEIIYSKIRETENFDDRGKIAKKALLFPYMMKTAVKDVPCFDAELKSFLGSGWDFLGGKSTHDKLKRILSFGQKP